LYHISAKLQDFSQNIPKNLIGSFHPFSFLSLFW